MRTLTRLAMAASLTAIVGCGAGNIGKNFNDSFVPKIEKNVTTKAMIRQNIGEPSSVTTTSSGETWTYMYTDAYAQSYTQAYTYGLYQAKPTNKTLIILFSGDVVAEYTYTR